ncbi:MAG: DUF4249 family protein [Bacteroidales bacterium]|nr:DUF4249 family protein [Bacteroidales bacterium]
MVTRLWKTLLLPLLFICVSCISVLDDMTCDVVDAYVIEATVSTCDTMQKIKIFNGIGDETRGPQMWEIPVDSIVITDNIGGRWKYEKPNNGWEDHYSLWVKSKGWPVVGRTYTLDVCIEGCHYYATETVLPCPKISRVTEVPTISKEGNEVTKIAIHFIHDKSDEESFCYFHTAWSTTYFSTKGFRQGENTVVKSDGFGVITDKQIMVEYLYVTVTLL